VNDFHVTSDHRVYLNSIEIKGCHGFDVSDNAENGPEVVIRIAAQKVTIGDYAGQQLVLAGSVDEKASPDMPGYVRIDRVHLATAMARANINLKMLSQLSGINRTTIYNIRSGKLCRRKTAEKLAEVLCSDILDTYPGHHSA